jgi:hypothetical protein
MHGTMNVKSRTNSYACQWMELSFTLLGPAALPQSNSPKWPLNRTLGGPQAPSGCCGGIDTQLLLGM